MSLTIAISNSKLVGIVAIPVLGIQVGVDVSIAIRGFMVVVDIPIILWLRLVVIISPKAMHVDSRASIGPVHLGAVSVAIVLTL